MTSSFPNQNAQDAELPSLQSLPKTQKKPSFRQEQGKTKRKSGNKDVKSEKQHKGSYLRLFSVKKIVQKRSLQMGK